MQRLTYTQQWNGHFPQEVWRFVSIVVEDSQLNHVMNVFDWPDVKDVRTGIRLRAEERKTTTKKVFSCQAGLLTM